MTDATSRFDVQPSVGNHFAWMRTMMGLQRTQLAAVRTATSLIGFGFTVAQFFQKLQGNLPEGLDAVNPAMPRNVGLVLIAAGVLSLVIFTLHFHREIAYLRSGPFATIAAEVERHRPKPSYIVSWVVMAIGVLAFGSVFLRF
jgi:putative membrane protein